MINAKLFWLGGSKRLNSETPKSAIWYAFEPETCFCRDDKRKVVLKRLYSASQKKQNTETMECCEQVVGCVTIIIYISLSMINMLSNDT